MQAQKQTISGSSPSENLSLILTSDKLHSNLQAAQVNQVTKTKAVLNPFTCGLGSITQTACESAYTFFAKDGSSFKKDTKLYWDPSLSTPVTWGTLIVNHADNSIWNFNSATSMIGMATVEIIANKAKKFVRK